MKSDKARKVTSREYIMKLIYQIEMNKEDIENIEERAKEYQYYNSAIETSFIENTKLLPHLEHPQEVFKIIQMFFV